MISALGFPYFWFCIVQLVGSAVTRWIFYLRGSTLYSLLDILLSTTFLPALLAYYGHLTSKAFLIPLAWQVFAAYVVLESLRFFFTAKTREAYAKLGVAKSVFAFGIMTAVSLPFIWALVEYTFFSRSIFASG